MNDTERIDWLESATRQGMSPALVFDDDGRWAVSFCGYSPVHEGEGFLDAVEISAYVEPGDWRPSIREAIDHAAVQLKLWKLLPQELRILHHALGREGNYYRNRYTAHMDSTTYQYCINLVRDGLLTKGEPIDSLVTFQITELGIELIRGLVK